MNDDQFDDGRERVDDHEAGQSQNDEREGFDDQRMRNDRSGLESDNECQQIDRERQDPEQRDSRRVGGDVEGDREQKARGYRRESNEYQTVAPSGRGFLAASCSGRRRSAGSGHRSRWSTAMSARQAAGTAQPPSDRR